MKTTLLLVILTLASCKSPAGLTITSPAVQAQVFNDVIKTAFAGGGALLVSGGNGGAAVAAMTAQEIRNIPALQKVIENSTPVTVALPATATPAVTPTTP